MAGPFDFTGKNIEDTYQRVVQTDGTNFYDGTGSAVSIGGGSQNLQQVTDQGSITTTPITASIISASSYEGFGTDLQIASASNISNLYITEFRETGSSFSNTGQPEIGSILVLDISGSGDGNESVLRRMDFQAFNKAFYASASYQILLGISASIAENVAEGQFANGIFYQNGIVADLDQDGNVGVNDLLIFLSNFGQPFQNIPVVTREAINKEQLRDVNALHEGIGDTQLISGSLLITTASFSGSSKPLYTSLTPGTLKVDSHITSSGNIKANGLIINGNINATGTTTANDYNLSSDGGVGLSNNYSGITFRNNDKITLGFGGDWTMDFEKDTGVVLYEYANLGTGNLSRDFRIEGRNDSHLLFVSGHSSTVGIGTDTPVAKLDVSGDINTTSHITASGNISASGTITADSFIGIVDGGTF